MARHLLLSIAAFSAVLTSVTHIDAQTPDTPTQRTVVAGPDYDASGIKLKLLGEGWRDLWLTPVRVPVFDIATYAGGVKVGEKGGGNQTRTLHFIDKSGRDYLFRSVNKFPVGQAMPPAIHGTTLGTIIQDQVSALMPAGGLMMPPFFEANGILHLSPRLYVMPDDPALGQYREEFAGLLGTVELSPQEGENDTPGFAGSRKVKGGDNFLEDVEAKRENRLDERELFAVRLVDFIINDNDRTTDNIRFARFGKEGSYIWRPIPRDRDRAFADAGGWIIKYIVRPVYPKLVEFGPDFDLDGLTFESYPIDRRLLQRITRSDADAIALKVQAAVTDQVIESAIAALPPEWRERTEATNRLRTNLRARRDRLPEVSREFYEWLATDVDVHGTDEKERAVLTRLEDGRVTVTLWGKGEPESAPPFSTRTFIPGETREVRVFLHGDDDIAVVRGAANDAITLRIIGGGGDDVLADSAGGGATRFYDEKGDNEFVTRDGTRVSEKEWKAPRQGAGIRFDAPWVPDWGKSAGFGPAFDFVQGGGVVVGYGPSYKSQGFRRLPHKWEAGAKLMLGLGNLKPGVVASADYRFENSPKIFNVDAAATKYEAFRFFGFGNNTPEISRDRSLVDQDIVSIEPSLIHQIGWRSREDLSSGFGKDEAAATGLRPLIGLFEIGPVFRYNRAHPTASAPFAGVDMQTVARAGARVGLRLDRTSAGPPSSRGFTFRTEVTGFPALLDLDEILATIDAVGAAYLPLGVGGSHLAVRAGGRALTGDYPVQEAAYVGGASSVRGYTSHRYIGDKSGYGSAELRVPVGMFPLLIKWNTGLFGLADAGRVWLNGDSPGGWHAGFGGGVWFSSLGQTFSVAFAHGEGNKIYLQRGMSF